MTATLEAPVARRPHEPLRISPGLALFVIWAGGAAVLALWWKDTTFVIGLDGWLTNAGRITGLLAGYLVVVLLALMARVPALERGVGTDQLARWHAMAGRYTVSLVVAHTLLIIWGYAVTAHTNVVHETGGLLTTYPDVLMATVATGLFVAVGVASARAARRRLRYETWHFIHLYTYLAVALAFSHQFSTGADFVTNRPARLLWAAMYIAVAALLFWFRLVRPVAQGLRHRMRVVEVRRESSDTVSVWLTGRHLEELGAEPGQFFRWRFLARGMWWAANPYSLSAPPRPDLLRITVKAAGDHSRALAAVRPGTPVLAEGPFGAFTAARRRQRNVLLLAGGVGITPLRALFESLPGGPGEVTLVYRARNAGEVVFRDELEWIAGHRGARVHYLLGRRGRGRRADPLNSAALDRLVPGLRGHDVYVCGPPGMTHQARRALRQAGVPRRQIHHESFTF
ncbi:MAG TPA: ferredoxin reductase family protein [Jatrophihabitantaceae bacterium]